MNISTSLFSKFKTFVEKYHRMTQKSEIYVHFTVQETRWRLYNNSLQTHQEAER